MAPRAAPDDGTREVAVQVGVHGPGDMGLPVLAFSPVRLTDVETAVHEEPALIVKMLVCRGVVDDGCVHSGP